MSTFPAERRSVMNLSAWIWLGLIVLFLAAEGATAGLVSLWFAGGAVAALIAALVGAGAVLQLILFFAVSAVLLALLRPLARKFVSPRIVPTNVDSIVGTVGRVTSAVDNMVPTGAIKLDTMEWTARSASGEPIPVGTPVRVDRIEGVKAIVSPVEKKSVNQIPMEVM